jgi:LPXTG-motif cell wall-anchored protein
MDALPLWVWLGAHALIGLGGYWVYRRSRE